ncbi:MAG: alpha/beta hydrolase [Leptospiraceae bacterium]|nr:alpha/beta hydrolase [Leptospiraceae bacterium]
MNQHASKQAPQRRSLWNRRCLPIAVTLVWLLIQCGGDSAGEAQAQSEDVDSISSRTEPIVVAPADAGERDYLIQSKYSDAAGHEQLFQVAVTVFSPAGEIQGDVLVLPGWDHHRLRYLNETGVKQAATQRRMRLICPQMDRSVYASAYFPETRMRWQPKPGQPFILEDLIPHMQAQGYLRPKGNNYLLGISTGARGAALIALAKPDLFRGVALLSGDYDQSTMPNDTLMTATYGPYDQFAERWQHTDNVQSRVADWKLPVYIWHGSQDSIVPFQQSQDLYRALQKAHPDLSVQFHAPTAGHDYPFWDAATPAALDFLLQYK